MDDFNTYEYGAEQKSEGKWKILRILVFAAYILFAGAYFLVLYIIRLIPLFAIMPILLWILIYFTWGYTKPDYRYFIESGNFIFYAYYSKKRKRKKTEFKISSAEAIDLADNLAESIKAFHPKHTYRAIPSVKSTDVYAALYKNEKGDKCVIYFVATKQSLKLMHFYNSKTQVTETAF